MSDPGGSGNRWEPTDSEPVAAEPRSNGPDPDPVGPDPVGRGTPGPTEPTASAPNRSRRRERGLLAGVAAVFLVGGGVGGYVLAPGGADAARPDPAGVHGHPPGDDGDGDGHRQQGRRT